MSGNMSGKLWLQISAGDGPAECSWVVVQVMERLMEDATASGLAIRTVDLTPGPNPGTAQSVLLELDSAESVDGFVNRWRGTVQWVARSPFRPQHRRKNWFVGVEVLRPVPENRFDPREVQVETMRSSGPGGQHVNRTESAVRVTHLPTGLQATASEERSQHSNRKLAMARLAQRIAEIETVRQGETRKAMWRAHHELERGNPVRVFRREGQE